MESDTSLSAPPVRTYQGITLLLSLLIAAISFSASRRKTIALSALSLWNLHLASRMIAAHLSFSFSNASLASSQHGNDTNSKPKLSALIGYLGSRNNLHLSIIPLHNVINLITTNTIMSVVMESC